MKISKPSKFQNIIFLPANHWEKCGIASRVKTLGSYARRFTHNNYYCPSRPSCVNGYLVMPGARRGGSRVVILIAGPRLNIYLATLGK